MVACVTPMVHVPSTDELAILDVLTHPARASVGGILVTPMLIKLPPALERRLIGTLSNTQPVLLALASR